MIVDHDTPLRPLPRAALQSQRAAASALQSMFLQLQAAGLDSPSGLSLTQQAEKLRQVARFASAAAVHFDAIAAEVPA